MILVVVIPWIYPEKPQDNRWPKWKVWDTGNWDPNNVMSCILGGGLDHVRSLLVIS